MQSEPGATAMMDPATAMGAGQPDLHPEAETSSMYTPPMGAVPATDHLEAPTPAFGSPQVPSSGAHEDRPTGGSASPYLTGRRRREEATELPTMAIPSPNFADARPAEAPSRQQPRAPAATRNTRLNRHGAGAARRVRAGRAWPSSKVRSTVTSSASSARPPPSGVALAATSPSTPRTWATTTRAWSVRLTAGA